jgi:hypothetical protein
MCTLAVRNAAQKILFDEELSGQISDGMWENSAPRDHWRPWSRAEVVVDPINVGRDFYAQKDNYGINRRDLLDIVGDRMLASVQRALPSYTRGMMLADLRDLKVIFRTRRS